MRQSVSILTILFICLQSVSSQVRESRDSRILFRGQIMDASSLSPIENSQITINKEFSSLSGKDGTFSFLVNKSDTITFRSLGYKPSVMLISDTLCGQEFVAGVFLSMDTVSINGVIILPGLRNLKSDLFNTRNPEPAYMSNAKYNVALSAYQGKTSQSNLGNPIDNYAVISQRQKTDAYERGGIPSDRMIGFSPLALIPAAYLLMHGLPEGPKPFSPGLTQQEIDQIHKLYMEKKSRNK
jgi:hypothetical protein